MIGDRVLDLVVGAAWFFVSRMHWLFVVVFTLAAFIGVHLTP